MKREQTDFIFVVVLVVLVVGVAIWNPQVTPSGSASGINVEEQAEVPHVKLISPGKSSTLYGDVQKFAFDVESVNYEIPCYLYINGLEEEGPVSVYKSSTFTTYLEPGYYKWRIECNLLTGKSISSSERGFHVEPAENFRSDRMAATGMVVQDTDSVSLSGNEGLKGILLSLLVLGAVSWLIGRKKSS